MISRKDLGQFDSGILPVSKTLSAASKNKCSDFISFSESLMFRNGKSRNLNTFQILFSDRDISNS